jgi:Sugar (and other) transporter
MLGYVVDVALMDAKKYFNWRLMLGSTVIAPIFVYFCPESPRWYLKKNQPRKAYEFFRRLRTTKVQAARDLYYTQVNLEIELWIKKNLVAEMFTVPRNRRAALASWIVMFMPQFCGVNVNSYSSEIFTQDGGFNERCGLLAALGSGIVN